jgi:signal peptidase II
LGKIVKQQYSKGFIICAALIYAGALGNLIDSMFYGLIFSESDAGLVATAFPPGGGYAGFLHGKVVDMLYFPIIKTEKLTFFSAIFNIADASISVGVITLLLFQKSFFKRHHEEEHPVVQTNTDVTDETQVS